LRSHHDVLAPTLAGHAGGPPIPGEASDGVITDLVEHAMDEAGFPTTHIVGNSLGGYIALQLAARSRAETVVALAPAGGWAEGDESFKELLAYQRTTQELLKAAAPHADAIVATTQGRRRATKLISENFEHIPAELLAHQMRGLASCDGAVPLIQYAIREGWSLRAERITCPVRILWGTEDKTPAVAAERRALPRGMAATSGLGRPGWRRTLPPTRHSARDGRANRRLHSSVAALQQTLKPSLPPAPLPGSRRWPPGYATRSPGGRLDCQHVRSGPSQTQTREMQP
jgi:pimeloyl-ACP methyl ester carboxylesterase